MYRLTHLTSGRTVARFDSHAEAWAYLCRDPRPLALIY